MKGKLLRLALKKALRGGGLMPRGGSAKAARALDSQAKNQSRRAGSMGRKERFLDMENLDMEANRSADAANLLRKRRRNSPSDLSNMRK